MSYEPLVPGSYFGKKIDAYLGAIGSKDTPAFVITFSITHVARDGQWQGIEPVSRDVVFFLSEGAKSYSFADLAKIGFNGNFDAPAFTDPLENGTELDVINELYDGKTNDRVRIAKLKAGREKKPVAADLKRSLAAQFKTAVSATARPAAPLPPVRPAAPAVRATPNPAYVGPHVPAPDDPAWVQDQTSEPPL